VAFEPRGVNTTARAGPRNCPYPPSPTPSQTRSRVYLKSKFQGAQACQAAVFRRVTFKASSAQALSTYSGYISHPAKTGGVEILQDVGWPSIRSVGVDPLVRPS
jgi:hypothetical protein